MVEHHLYQESKIPSIPTRGGGYIRCMNWCAVQIFAWLAYSYHNSIGAKEFCGHPPCVPLSRLARVRGAITKQVRSENNLLRISHLLERFNLFVSDRKKPTDR